MKSGIIIAVILTLSLFVLSRPDILAGYVVMVPQQQQSEPLPDAAPIGYILLSAARTLTVTRAVQVFVVDITANATLTMADPPNTNASYRLTTVFRQGQTGNRVLGLAGNVSTPGGVVPILSTGANAVDVLDWVWGGNRWKLVGAAFGYANLQ